MLRKAPKISDYSVFDSLKTFLTFLTMLLSDCFFFYFWYSCFLFSRIHIVDTCWFTVFLGCVSFKNTHNFVFNITKSFFVWWKMYLSNEGYRFFFANSFFHLFLILKGYSLSLKFWGVFVYCLSIFSKYFHFNNIGAVIDSTL